jgi:hypothetical protein
VTPTLTILPDTDTPAEVRAEIVALSSAVVTLTKSEVLREQDNQ